MKFEDSFTVPVARKEVWDALTDIERIYPALPGAELIEVKDNEFHGKVKMTNDIEITGKAAQFGRGILQDVSKEIMADFARNLEEMLTAPDGADESTGSDASAAPAAAESTPAAPTPAPPAGSSLSVMGLMGRVAKRRAAEQPVVTALVAGLLIAIIVVIVILIV